MFQYQLDANRIIGFLKNNPTLIQKRRKLAKAGKRFAEPEEVTSFISEAIQSAGQKFLARIHQEMFDAKPYWERRAIEKDLEALARGEEFFGEELVASRPELTTEYLLSIGRPDLVNL